MLISTEMKNTQKIQPMTDKRLIEGYLPIKETFAKARREKSVQQPYISTLHLGERVTDDHSRPRSRAGACRA